MSERFNRSIEFAFVGGASIVVQAIFVRRLVGLFGGSEITYALVLTLWLIQTGLSSWLADQFRLGSRQALRRRLAVLYCSLAALLPFYLLIAPFKALFFTDLGPVPLSHIAVFSLLVLIPPTLFPGAAFAMILHVRKAKDSNATVGHAYLFDSIGFALGGILLTLLLSVSGRDWVPMLFLSAVAMARCAALRFGKLLSTAITVACSLAAVASVYLMGQSVAIWHSGSASDRGCPDSYYYRTQESATSSTRLALSPYGHIRAVYDGLTLNIYYNSRRISTFPDPPTQESVTLPLAMCSSPRSICIIGNSCDGKAIFAAYDTSLAIVQVEPDPVLCNLFRNVLLPSVGSGDVSRRLRLVHADPVEFLRGSVEKYDQVYLNYSHISGVAEGVYFSREFLELVKSSLNSGGVIAFSSQCGENFIQPETLEYIKNLQVTLSMVFPKVLVIPGEDAILIGGMPDSRLTFDPNEILAALVPYRNHLAYFGDAYLPDRLSEFRREKLDGLLASVKGEELTASEPKQHLLNAILEMDKFSGIDSAVLRSVRNLPDSLTVTIAILPLILLIVVGFARKGNTGLLIPAFFSGWWALSSEILLMVLYQSVSGNLYSRLGLLAGLSMLGIAAGAWAGGRAAVSRIRITRSLGHVLVGGTLIGFLAALVVPELLADFGGRAAGELLIYLLAILSGAISGAIFNLSAARYARLKQSELPGRFYGTDLFGAAFGGLTTTVLVLPLVGIQTGFLILSLAALLVSIYSYGAS